MFLFKFFIANLIKGKFKDRTEVVKETLVNHEPVKVKRVKETEVKEEKAKAIKEFSKNPDNIEKRRMKFMKK